MSTQCRTIHIVVWANFLAAFGAILDCHLSRKYHGQTCTYLSYSIIKHIYAQLTSPLPLFDNWGIEQTYPLKETIQVAKVLYTLSAVEVWREGQHLCPLYLPLGEDTENGNGRHLGFVQFPMTAGVHNRSEEGILVRCVVLL